MSSRCHSLAEIGHNHTSATALPWRGKPQVSLPMRGKPWEAPEQTPTDLIAAGKHFVRHVLCDCGVSPHGDGERVCMTTELFIISRWRTERSHG